MMTPERNRPAEQIVEPHLLQLRSLALSLNQATQHIIRRDLASLEAELGSLNRTSFELAKSFRAIPAGSKFAGLSAEAWLKACAEVTHRNRVLAAVIRRARRSESIYARRMEPSQPYQSPRRRFHRRLAPKGDPGADKQRG